MIKGDIIEYYCDINRHLVCKPYSIENLHIMAKDLKIKKCWYHPGAKPHYDIPKKRVKEISDKCNLITSRDIIKIIKNIPI